MVVLTMVHISREGMMNKYSGKSKSPFSVGKTGNRLFVKGENSK
jgi:hypothetical protein